MYGVKEFVYSWPVVNCDGVTARGYIHILWQILLYRGLIIFVPPEDGAMLFFSGLWVYIRQLNKKWNLWMWQKTCPLWGVEPWSSHPSSWCWSSELACLGFCKSLKDSIFQNNNMVTWWCCDWLFSSTRIRKDYVNVSHSCLFFRN